MNTLTSLDCVLAADYVFMVRAYIPNASVEDTVKDSVSHTDLVTVVSRASKLVASGGAYKVVIFVKRESTFRELLLVDNLGIRRL